MKQTLLKKQNIILLAAIVAAAVIGSVFLLPGGGKAPAAEGDSHGADGAATAAAEEASLPDSETPLSDGGGSGAKDAAGNLAKGLAAMEPGAGASNGDASTGTDSTSAGSGASPAELAKQIAESAVTEAEEQASQNTGTERLPGPDSGEQQTGGKVTLSIDCYTILNNMDQLEKSKEPFVGSGVIMAPRTASFNAGETVFDVLYRECRASGIHMSSKWTPIYDSAYIEGINQLYEFDCGNLSGWMYKVNGWFPNYGCSQYYLKDGDVVEWRYTCDLGADVGGGYALGG